MYRTNEVLSSADDGGADGMPEWRSLSQHLDFLLEQASETTFFRSKDFVMISDEHLELCRFTSAAINSLAVVFGLFMATFYGGLLRPPGTDGVGGKPALFVFLLCNSIGIAFSMAGLLARLVYTMSWWTKTDGMTESSVFGKLRESLRDISTRYCQLLQYKAPMLGELELPGFTGADQETQAMVAQAYINALALALAHMTADQASTGKLVNPEDVVRVVSVHSEDRYQWSALFIFAFWRGLVFAKRTTAASAAAPEGLTAPSTVLSPPLPPEEEAALLQLAIEHSSAVSRAFVDGPSRDVEVTDRLLSVHTSVAWIMRTALCISQEVRFMQRWLFYTVVCAFAVVISGTGSVVAGQLSLVTELSKCIPTLVCFKALFALVAFLTPLHVREAFQHASLRSHSITNSEIKQRVAPHELLLNSILGWRRSGGRAAQSRLLRMLLYYPRDSVLTLQRYAQAIDQNLRSFAQYLAATCPPRVTLETC